MANYKAKLHDINTFIFDFDGVLSDGKVYVQRDGEQVRATDVKDGYAMQYALKRGYRIAIISGGYAESMRLRYEGFPGIEIFLSVSNKIELFKEYMAKPAEAGEHLGNGRRHPRLQDDADGRS